MAYPDKKDVPVGAMTYIHNWIKEQLYGRHKDFSSKYTEKGNLVEKSAIEYAAKVYGWGMVEKNEEMLEDEFMIGTPDLILSDLVPDIKNAWDCFTFPLLDAKEDKSYWWQLQGYMALTGKPAAAIIYCLMDAPEEIIDREARNICYKAGLTEVDADLYEQVQLSMTYSNLPDSLRIKRFDVQRDDKAIEQIKVRVTACAEYVASLNIQQYTNQLKAA